MTGSLIQRWTPWGREAQRCCSSGSVANRSAHWADLGTKMFSEHSYCAASALHSGTTVGDQKLLLYLVNDLTVEEHIADPFTIKWTFEQLIQPADYWRHLIVLRSAPAFYLTALKKLIPGFSHEMKHLHLADGHVIPVQDFMTLYIYKEIFVDRCYDLTFDKISSTNSRRRC